MTLPAFNQLDAALLSRNVADSKQAYSALCSNHDKSTDLIKSHLELCLRQNAFQMCKNEVSTTDVQAFLDFIVHLAQEDMCAKPLTVTILQDIFDISTKKTSEMLFAVVENMIVTWKTPFFFDSCKNSILRMCNDLLKRLSQTVDTAFCGRILILLAKALPLNERSGLNLMSQINLGNVTTFDDQDVEMKDETEEDNAEMEVGEIREQKDLNIDYELYVKFWKLQSFFVSPTQIYNSDKWLSFESDLVDVLTLFSTHKLEKPREEETTKTNHPAQLNGIENGTEKLQHIDEFNSFSAKYLTNQKLFHLQIADSQFRRYFLTQCLIFTSYLSNSSIKSRDPTLFLTSAQEKTVADWTDKCYQLLKETYPHGSKFADSLKKAIKSDKLWSDWKNDGCPDLVSEIPAGRLAVYKRKEIEPYNPDIIDLGNAELTRLWNINTNNLSACKADDRIFKDVFKTVLDDFLDEVDPEQQVEEQYMKINDEKFQWTCSRHLLYNNYPQYSMSSVNSANNKTDFASTTTYLKKVLLKVASTTELKDRAAEIEKRLDVVAQKQAEQEELARKTAIAAAEKRARRKVNNGEFRKTKQGS
ncbi:Death domain-containing protein [Aphelenchoides bicaudatus]|nr:Death domain-containing protein [Aphelenchoides bicaudatus]